MADKGERRMLFDIRGRRKNVVRVVYAVLALLMGASLFVAVGPFNLGELIGSGGSGSAEEVYEDQVERIEGRLAANPKDPGLLISLTRARINAGNAKSETNPETGGLTPSPEARQEFNLAMEAWNRYLKQAGDNPNPAAAQLVALTFFRLAEASGGVREAEENVAAATKAQEIVAESRPNAGSLTTLAIYQYFNSDFAGGDRTKKLAVAKAPTEPEAKNVEKELARYRKSGKQFEQRKKLLSRAQQQVEEGASGNPFGFPRSGAPPGE